MRDLFDGIPRFGRGDDDEARKSDLVDVDLHYAGKTDRALAVKKDKADKEWIWLPLSQIEYETTGVGTCRVTMPEALATEKGLV